MTRVLWLSNETPDRLGQGGQRRQFFQIRELTRAGHSVTVCCLSGPQDDTSLHPHAHVIRTRTHWRGRFPLPAHSRLLKSLLDQEWGAVVVAHTESWPTFRRWLRTASVPTWVDLHNVLGRDTAGDPTPWLDVERDICAGAAMVSVCSSLESTRLLDQQRDVRSDPTVLQHGIDLAEWQTARNPARTPVVKLFGNWDWGPNRRGLDWFLTRVWPQVQEKDARCEIAGAGAVIPPACQNVTFVGRVPSLDVWTSDAWAVAVPVVDGIGAPVKYLEAIATRAPVLGTPDGAPYAHRAAALVSLDPQAWTATLKDLLAGGSPPPDSGVNLHEFSWAAATAPLLTWLSGR